MSLCVAASVVGVSLLSLGCVTAGSSSPLLEEIGSPDFSSIMSSGNMTPELSSPDGSFRPSLANSSGGVDSGRSLDVPNGPSLPTLNSIPSPAEASAFDKPRESDSRREKTRKRGSRTKKGNNDATEQMSTVKWQNLQNLQV